MIGGPTFFGRYTSGDEGWGGVSVAIHATKRDLMDERFIVLDVDMNDCGAGTFGTEAAAAAHAKELAKADHDEEEYFVAEVIGRAAQKTEPRPVTYTSLRKPARKKR